MYKNCHLAIKAFVFYWVPLCIVTREARVRFPDGAILSFFFVTELDNSFVKITYFFVPKLELVSKDTNSNQNTYFLS